MTDPSKEPDSQGHLFGWCHGNDRHHHLCRRAYTSQFGVHHHCNCVHHQEDDD